MCTERRKSLEGRGEGIADKATETDSRWAAELHARLLHEQQGAVTGLWRDKYYGIF